MGHPSAERLHKATRGAERVAVYCWRHPDRIVKDLVGGQVFRGHDVELFVIDVALLDAVATTLTRNQRWSLSVSGGVMYLEIGGAVHSGAAERRFLPDSGDRIR